MLKYSVPCRTVAADIQEFGVLRSFGSRFAEGVPLTEVYHFLIDVFYTSHLDKPVVPVDHGLRLNGTFGGARSQPVDAGEVQ